MGLFEVLEVWRVRSLVHSLLDGLRIIYNFRRPEVAHPFPRYWKGLTADAADLIRQASMQKAKRLQLHGFVIIYTASCLLLHGFVFAATRLHVYSLTQLHDLVFTAPRVRVYSYTATCLQLHAGARLRVYSYTASCLQLHASVRHSV